MYVCVSQSPSKKVPREVMMFPDDFPLMDKFMDKPEEATSELKVANAEPRPKRAAASRAIVLQESSTEESDDDLPLASVVTKEKSSSAEARKNSSKRKRVAKEEPPEKREPQVAFDLTDDTPTPTQQTLDEDLVLTQQTQQTDATEGTQDYEKPASSQPGGRSSEFVVVLPEKGVSRTKVLVQFDKNSSSKLDLSGDVGAVGRFLVTKKGRRIEWKGGKPYERGKDGDQSMLEGGVELRVDLKGQLYNCSVVPTCTTMVLKVDKAKDAREATVESIATDVLRLDQDVYTHEGRHHDSSAPEGRDVTKPRPKHKKARA